ncbi:MULTISPECIES: WPE palindromic element domain-containing protein [Wolbachia]|uniref:Uncharacterized protein n=1 Tax=Wolbachia pipientis TaxID=955 RepID=A0A6I6CKZ5_WOLPI|nr:MULTISPECIES: WPE palindromic element domain-containing protein [Wolbachia]MBS9529308.1 hypothetical protein [Wolbachia endosymbiont of Ceratitis capitata]QGT16781.1 hypothetical protein E0495_06440 [Wolbachia pipientis]
MYAIAILRFIPQLYEHLFLLNTTKMSSQCPDYLDPENLISTKWLHNKGWIPVPSTGMTAIYVIPPRTVIPRFIRGISSAN